MPGKRCSAIVPCCCFQLRNYFVNVHIYIITTCNLTFALSSALTITKSPYRHRLIARTCTTVLHEKKVEVRVRMLQPDFRQLHFIMSFGNNKSS